MPALKFLPMAQRCVGSVLGNRVPTTGPLQARVEWSTFGALATTMVANTKVSKSCGSLWPLLAGSIQGLASVGPGIRAMRRIALGHLLICVIEQAGGKGAFPPALLVA